MTVATTDSFLELLQRSNLLEPKQVAEAQRLAAEIDRPKDLAKTLAREGILTRWQAAKLLSGRVSFYVGKYKLLDLLGRGGMGRVFLGQHTTMNRPVALKIISKDVGKDPASLERFFTEARAIAALDHPNIVHAYNVDNEGDHYYMVMEFIEGQDLQRRVDANGPLDFEEAADYIRQAADGLAHAHGRNMIHCDIKPANLLVNGQGVVKILDMGMARLVGRGEDGLSDSDERVIGTVDYLAPEQALESPHLDHRVDIYSLGCTFYFLLTGHAPFPEGTLHERILKHQTQKPRSIRHARPGAPKDLVKIVDKMMAKEPGDRHQTAEEVSRVLAEWRPAKQPALLRAVPLDDTVDGAMQDTSPLGIRVVQDKPGTRQSTSAWATDEPAGGDSGSGSVKQGFALSGRLAALRQEKPWAFYGGGAAAAIVFLAVVVTGVYFLLPGSRGGGPPVVPGEAVSHENGQPDGSAVRQPPPKQPNEEDSWSIQFPPQGFEQTPREGETPDGSAEAPPGETGAEPSTEPVPGPSEPAPEKPPAEKPPEKPPAEKPPNKPPDKPPDKPPNKPPNKTPQDPLRELTGPVPLPLLKEKGAVGEPTPLVTVHTPPDETWYVSLLGGEHALASNPRLQREFVLDERKEDNPGLHWVVQLAQTPAGEDTTKTDVAKFTRDKEKLLFQWTETADPDEANYLCNCMLRVRVGTKGKNVPLRQPAGAQPLALNMARGTASVQVPLDYLPDEEQIKLEFTGIDGFKAAEWRYDPPKPDERKPFPTLVFIYTDRNNNAHDALTYRVELSQRGGLSLSLRLVGPQARVFRQMSNDQQRAIARTGWEEQAKKLEGELNPKDPKKRPNGEQRSILSTKIGQAEGMLWAIEFYEKMNQTPAIHFKVSFPVDKEEVVLASG